MTVLAMDEILLRTEISSIGEEGTRRRASKRARRAQGVGEGARGGEQRRRARVARLLAETGELEAARGRQRACPRPSARGSAANVCAVTCAAASAKRGWRAW